MAGSASGPSGMMRCLMGGAFGVFDLVAHVVLAGRLVHRNALDFPQREAVVDDQRAVVVPDAEQQVASVAREFDMGGVLAGHRSEEHTSALQSLMRISYAVFCLKKKT